jgi:hypothetical protein
MSIMAGAAPSARKACSRKAAIFPIPDSAKSHISSSSESGSSSARRYEREVQLAYNKKKTFGPSELSKVVGKWSSTELIFAVREPFPSRSTGTNIVFGTISPSQPLRIESLMGENGVIFSDGIENDYIAFNSGAEAVIGLADKRGRMVV